MAASSNAVVQSAEQAVSRLPGGPIIAAAVRASAQPNVAPAETPEGATSALGGSTSGIGGTSSVGASGGNAGVEGVLSQSSEQNLYYLGLQERISQENRSYTALSNVLKARHETLKNAIGNIR
jgi:type IV secretory pathway TrbL component